MLFDTHVHLSDPQFNGDREEVLRRCLERGVAVVVEIADSPKDWDKALALARAHPGRVLCSLGLHPYPAGEWREDIPAALRAAARPGETVAVGEIGLDYAKCQVPRDVQARAFRGMLAAAEQVGLPVVIHCREAYADLLPLLRDAFGARRPAGRFHGVVHCFSGTAEEALECRDLGFALGADGPVTYPKNEPLRQALKGAGLDCLVLETDSPYLPPQSSRGKRNEPSAIPEIAAALAKAFGLPEAELAEATSRNAAALYRLSRSGD